MGALDWYLLKRLASTFAIVLLGVVGLAATLDILANGDEAIRDSEGLGNLGVYLVARLPLIAMKFAPIAALLAALTTLLNLTRSGELSAAGALGASPGRIARALLPACLILAAALYLIGELAAPPASAKLRAMGLEPFAKIARSTDAVWLRENADVIRIGRVSEDENELDDVTIFRRDDVGRLAYEISAERAERDGEGWRLLDVVVERVDGGAPEAGALMLWPTSFGPQSFKILTAHPSELSLEDVRALARFPGASPKPPFFYEVWSHRKFAAPISAALLILLAIPFAGGLARGRSIATPMALGLLTGFVYSVFETLSTAAAETGAIAPVAGAWGPPIILALGILALAAFQEKPG